jgi:hypothetical protein
VKRIAGVLLLLAVALILFRMLRPISPSPQHPIPPAPSPQHPAPSSSPSLHHSNTPSTLTASVSNDLLSLRATLGNFLLAVKEPYRPPLGDNRDIARALTGHNRRGLVFVPTNDPTFRDGQLIDRWGTPYWFHPRAPDAIDIVSAGPDRTLFTADDLSVSNRAPPKH